MGKQKVLFLVLLVYALALYGCGVTKNNTSSAKLVNKNIGSTSADKEKDRLLRRIDARYPDSQAHYELGKLYQADGLWSNAEQEYGVALNFDPVLREAQSARVKTLYMMNDKAKADLLTDIYLNAAASSPMASLKLALGFQEHGLDDQALKAYEQALRLAPNSAKINRQIGFYYLSKGKDVQARDYLTRSFQLDPYQPDVAGQLGKLGVTVTIPRKIQNNTSNLDREIDKSIRSKK